MKVGFKQGGAVEWEVMTSIWSADLPALEIALKKKPMKEFFINGQCPMMALCKITDERAVKALELLLEYGMDVNQKGAEERTGLMEMAFWGRSFMTRRLLSKGADPTSVDEKGNSALMIAISKGSAGCALALLEAGAPVDTMNANGETPIHLAGKALDLSLTSMLLQFGADPEAQDMEGYTALDWVETHPVLDPSREGMRKLLVEAQTERVLKRKGGLRAQKRGMA